MLSCIVGNKSVNSFNYEESKLRGWSNKGILKCPECGEKVIYCHGDFKVPYFRHEVSSECNGCYAEPMTNEHINGIRNLYERLSKIDGVTNLEVEKYIKNTKQRPDIYFEYDGNRYCIEYQCSPISTQYNKRHELYELEGIKDIWILGTEKYNFEKYKEMDNTITFKEKKIKTIEDEIDRSDSPLLYLMSDKILKINSVGFEGIVRELSKPLHKNSPLKKTFKCKYNYIQVNSMDINYILEKENMNISEIHRLTNKTINRCEKLINAFNYKYQEMVVFKYNLEVDRCPIYQYYLGKYINVVNDVYCERIENDINEYSSCYLDVFNIIKDDVDRQNNLNDCFTIEVKLDKYSREFYLSSKSKKGELLENVLLYESCKFKTKNEYELIYNHVKNKSRDKFNSICEEKNRNVAIKNNITTDDNSLYLKIINKDDGYPKTISKIAKDYGMTGVELNKILCKLNIQNMTRKGGYNSEYGIIEYKKISYNNWTTYVKWDKSGARVIYETLKKNGIIPNIEKINFN